MRKFLIMWLLIGLGFDLFIEIEGSVKAKHVLNVDEWGRELHRFIHDAEASALSVPKEDSPF
jgi:hypothetical protein